MRSIVLVAAACGRLGFDAREATVDAPPPACTFGAPIRMPDELQSVGQDWEPALSPSGATLVFSSTRLSSSSFANNLFRADHSVGGWTTPARVLAVGQIQGGATWNAAGDTLYFHADTGSGPRLYSAPFDSTGFGAPALLPGLESTDAESPAVSQDEAELFFSTPDPSDPSVTPAKLVRATKTAGTWSVDGPLVELDATGEEGWPSLSADDLSMYFEMTLPPGKSDIYVTHRAAIGMPFDAPVPISAVNDAVAEDGDPDILGTTLVFASDRGHPADADLYLSTCN